MTYSVIIADDEVHARRYLNELLEHDTELVVLGTCKNGEEVLRFLKNKVPDFLFLDIQMPGISGLTVAEQIKQKNCEVIFTTAYNQYAVKAFEAEAFDYLLKPFNEVRLNQVLKRAKAAKKDQRKLEVQGRIHRMMERFAIHKNNINYLTEFVIKSRGLEISIKTSDVLYLQASSVYVDLITAKKSYLYRSALSLLEKQLSPSFIRIHRSVIINKDHVLSRKYLNNNRFEFRMSNDVHLTSSKAYKQDIANWVM